MAAGSVAEPLDGPVEPSAPWPTPAGGERARALAFALSAAGLLALVALSTVLRTRALHTSFWMDEALSVGIASHPFTAIPGLLRQDGSPPLYYLLLQAWISASGPWVVGTHLLSVLFAIATIPIAWWGGRSLFGSRGGWLAAALWALNPFLTAYAQETRMYALMALLSLVTTIAFLQAYVHANRRYVPVFAVGLAAMLYTHNWALFFTAAVVATLALLVVGARGRRVRLLRDGALGLLGAALLYAPWIPTLLYQSAHTGAPWLRSPRPIQILGALVTLLSGWNCLFLLAALTVVGITVGLLARRWRELQTVAASGALVLGTLVTAWLASQQHPAWTGRYLAVLLGPLLLGLAGALTLATAGRSVARLAVVAPLGLLVGVIWVLNPPRVTLSNKSNVDVLATRLQANLRPADLVISTQPEQVPTLHFYLPSGLRYATPIGFVRDPRVVDWRDGMARLSAARVPGRLARSMARIPPGRHVLIVTPNFGAHGWRSPWLATVKTLSLDWSRYLAQNRNLRAVNHFYQYDRTTRSGVQGIVYVKLARPRPMHVPPELPAKLTRV